MALRNFAPSKPSTTRWSQERVRFIRWPITISSPTTTGFLTVAPMAKIAAFGGLMIAQKRSIPAMPRLETQNVPPVNSAGCSFLSLARPPRALASVLIWKRLLASVSRMTGVIRPSSIATANETWIAPWD